MKKVGWLLVLLLLLLVPLGCGKKSHSTLLPFNTRWNVVQIQALIKEGADVNEKDDAGKTPLMYAVEASASTDVVSLLLTAGADVNAKDSQGLSPLSIAAANSLSPALIQILLEAGADIAAKDADGWTPVMHAAMYNPAPEVVQALIKAGAEVTPNVLMLAVINNMPEVVAALVATGVDVNVKDQEGWSQLMAAAIYSKHSETIRILLDAGADARALSPEGKTAYEYAGQNEHLRGTLAYQSLAEATGVK